MHLFIKLFSQAKKQHPASVSVQINLKLLLTLTDVFLCGLAVPWDPVVILCSNNTVASAQKVTRPVTVL